MTEVAEPKTPRTEEAESEEPNEVEKKPKKTKNSYFKSEDLKVKTNNEEHHTLQISETALTVRRGQKFTVLIHLTEPFHPDQNTLTFCAATGSKASVENGTKVRFGIPPGSAPSPDAEAAWKAELCPCSCPEVGRLSVMITPPGHALIGKYRVTMTYREEESLLTELVVLFNAWCPDDPVFLDDEAQRQEYVMNDEGLVYRGSSYYMGESKWDFGQFEDDMVEICMMILDKSHAHEDDPVKDEASRGDPIYVGRIVSAMINSEDDHGVLEGRWGGPYWNGRRPTSWSDSHAILKRWLDSDCKPVRYGQCWVFACVMCSVMRLLGIPTRVVTNFDSAHDTNENLLIDKYFNEDGVDLDSMDSVWNFHVWVESWMTRPDLSDDGKFNGWQVLDPTPQETSDGVYCCGPASVNGIKNGNTGLKYDVPFVFAEVNADCVQWEVTGGDKKEISRETNAVGWYISTKAVGEDKQMFITENYKYKEDSEKERFFFKKARRQLKKAKQREEERRKREEENAEAAAEENDEMEVDDEDDGDDEDDAVEAPPPKPLTLAFEEVSTPVNGKDVELKLVLHSNSEDVQSVSVNISVQSKTYTGSTGVNIRKHQTDHDLHPGKDVSVPIQVTFSEYWEPMLECDTMKITALVKDKKNPDLKYLCEDDVVLKDPPMEMTVLSEVTVGVESSVTVVFVNPVDKILKDCTLTFSGCGLFKEERITPVADLKPSESVTVQEMFTPYKVGKKVLVADFNCSVFRDVKASSTIQVQKKNQEEENQ